MFYELYDLELFATELEHSMNINVTIHVFATELEHSMNINVTIHEVHSQ